MALYQAQEMLLVNPPPPPASVTKPSCAGYDVELETVKQINADEVGRISDCSCTCSQASPKPVITSEAGWLCFCSPVSLTEGLHRGVQDASMFTWGSHGES